MDRTAGNAGSEIERRLVVFLFVERGVLPSKFGLAPEAVGRLDQWDGVDLSGHQVFGTLTDFER